MADSCTPMPRLELGERRGKTLTGAKMKGKVVFIFMQDKTDARRLFHHWIHLEEIASSPEATV